MWRRSQLEPAGAGGDRSVLANQRPLLRSDGSYTRDYIFVSDVVNAYVLLASKISEKGVQGEAFNFGLQSRITVMEMTLAVLRLMGREDLQPIIRNEAKGEIKDQSLDSSKARRLLGWAPSFKLEDGLKEPSVGTGNTLPPRDTSSPALQRRLFMRVEDLENVRL